MYLSVRSYCVRARVELNVSIKEASITRLLKATCFWRREQGNVSLCEVILRQSTCGT